MKPVKTFAITLTAVFLTAVAYAGEQPKADAPHKHGTAGGAMMEQCKAMMAKHQEMKARMEALDTKLEVKLAAAKAAKGDRKVDALAAVVEELVAQRREMREQMMSGMPQMMGHMMEHGQTGTMGGMQMSMADCPMMKEMMGAQGAEGGGEKTGDGGHSEHH